MSKAGQPMKYKTVGALKKAIEAYFVMCIEDKIPLTITGLAIALDFTSRQALINYEKTKGYEKFFDTVKKAKLMVQNYAETFLFTGKTVAGAIFNLKCNYGWEDKQIIEHSGKIETTATIINKPLKSLPKKK